MRFLRQSETGASLLEFAIVFPLFAVLVLAIIDFGRASALRAVVDEAVSRTLTKAISVANLDVDQAGPPQLDTGDIRYQRMHVARQLAEQEGLRFLQSVGQLAIASDAMQSAGNGAKLFDVVYTDTRAAGGPVSMTTKLMVLRPGECASVPSLGITECNRETLGTAPTDPPPMGRMPNLIERHPVKVFAYAELDSYVPFMFSAPIKVEAFGYRQPIPESPFSAAISEQYGLNEVIAGAPTSQLPLGKPVMPTPPPSSCDTPEEWAKAIEQSRLQSKPYVPTPQSGGGCRSCPLHGEC